MRVLILLFVVLFIMNENVCAQHEDHTSAYKGEETRAIKSLSADDLKELEEGKGWGFAKPAELNGYPGPSHILEMKEELELTPDQIARIETVFEFMNKKARQLGVKFIEAEKALDSAFKSGEVDTEILYKLVSASANTRGNLRFVHLDAHLSMMEILSKSQVSQYNQLRGYASGDPCESVPEGHDPQMWKKHNNCSE